jgi:hypothetical protein
MVTVITPCRALREWPIGRPDRPNENPTSPAMTNPTQPSPSAAIQFDRAVTSEGADKAPGVVCAMCNRKIVERYWTLGDQPACVSCKATIQRDAAKAKRPSVFAKSTVFGFGAAVAGAVLYYAVLKLLNLEIALVAIAIGYMVGQAMRKGASGWGGKRFQITAAALTYLAVGMAYLPLALEGASGEQSKANPATASAGDSTAALSDSAAIVDSILTAAYGTAARDSFAVAARDSVDQSDSTEAVAPVKASVAGGSSGILAVLFGFAAAFFFAMALPIIVIIGSMPGGLISALIIVFGMRQAWRMTAGNDLTFQGPLAIPK